MFNSILEKDIYCLCKSETFISFIYIFFFNFLLNILFRWINNYLVKFCFPNEF